MSTQQQPTAPPKLTKAQLFVKGRIEPILRFQGGVIQFLNMIKPLKKHIDDWGVIVKGCQGPEPSGYIQQAKGIIEAIYHEVQGHASVEVLDSDSDGGLDLDEIMSPENEDDRDFVAEDDAPMVYESPLKQNRSKSKRRRIEEEEESHIELHAAFQQDDDEEDEEHLKKLLAKKTRPEPIEVKLQPRKPKEDDPVISTKPAQQVVDRAALATADVAEVPMEFTDEKEFLDDESVQISEEEKEDAAGTESEELSGDEQEEEEEEERPDTNSKSKKPRYEKPECRYYKLCEKFMLKGQEYIVTYPPTAKTPLTKDDEIDWDKVTYANIAVCKGPPAGKKAPDSDYNAFVFSKTNPPHMISIKQAQKIDAKLDKKEREANKRTAMECDNIRKIAVKGEPNSFMFKTILPMNYYRQLMKKRSSRAGKETVLKDSTNQHSNKQAGNQTAAQALLKKLSSQRELFIHLPQNFEEEFKNTINSWNGDRLQNTFGPGADSFIEQYDAQENVGEAVKKWTQRWGNSKDPKEKEFIKQFMRHVVFVHPGAKSALLVRLKELATGS